MTPLRFQDTTYRVGFMHESILTACKDHRIA